MKEDGLFRAQQDADILGINTITLFRWEAAGKLPFAPVRDIRNWRVYDKRQVEWLQRNLKRLLQERG